MIHRTLLAIVAFVVATGLSDRASAEISNVKDCLPVLTKDYYSYAMQNNLQEDFLKSIDSESWETWQKSNDLGLWGAFAGGIFSLTDKYSEFDQKRSKYLENVHYNRTQQQALNILQLTTSNRAYSAYEKCLLQIGSGVPLRAWASSEDMSAIDLRVKYVNPAGKAQVILVGVVEGGSVLGAPAGRLWKGSKVWGVNQEKQFSIKRSSGASKTVITIVPDDGSTPVRLELSRADALLTLSYVGTTDALVAKDLTDTKTTPDNNENRGNCPREVGHHDGKYCTSRTTATIAVTAPFFLDNARGNYSNPGCPWCAVIGPSYGDGHLTADFTIDNWGSPVNVVLTADKYERLASAQCGTDQPIPVVFKQSVVLTSPKVCLPIATLHWKQLIGEQSEGTVHFGEKPADGRIAIDSSTESGSALLIGYQINY